MKTQIENIEVWCGDCLELMKNIPDGAVDMILCDLPYGTTACKWDTILPFESLWKQYWRIIKPNGAIVLTCGEPFSSLLRTSSLQDYKYDLKWIKPQGVDPFMSKIRPLYNFEDIAIFYKKQPVYNPQKTAGRPYKITRDKNSIRVKETGGKFKETTTDNSGDRLPVRTLYFKQERGRHPTQKPVALFEYLIKTYTNPGEIVLDNCSGSGTTGIAAYNTDRKALLIEKDEEYFRKSIRRLEKHIGSDLV